MYVENIRKKLHITMSLQPALSLSVRGPNLFFKYFYFPFGPGLFYSLRVPIKVQFFFGCLLTLLRDSSLAYLQKDSIYEALGVKLTPDFRLKVKKRSAICEFRASLSTSLTVQERFNLIILQWHIEIAM